MYSVCVSSSAMIFDDVSVVVIIPTFMLHSFSMFVHYTVPLCIVRHHTVPLCIGIHHTVCMCRT